MPPTRILMTGSRSFTDEQLSADALKAGIALLAATPRDSVLVHGAAAGADLTLAAVAQKLGLATEAHPAEWNVHTAACPEWDRGNRVCKLAGHRRNSEMIQAGASLCLAFPTHGYHLAPGESRANTSRGTWDCAQKARDAGLATLIVWGRDFYPFGEGGLELLQRDADRKSLTLGAEGRQSILDAWLPF